MIKGRSILVSKCMEEILNAQVFGAHHNILTVQAAIINLVRSR